MTLPHNHIVAALPLRSVTKLLVKGRACEVDSLTNFGTAAVKQRHCQFRSRWSAIGHGLVPSAFIRPCFRSTTIVDLFGAGNIITSRDLLCASRCESSELPHIGSLNKDSSFVLQADIGLLVR